MASIDLTRYQQEAEFIGSLLERIDSLANAQAALAEAVRFIQSLCKVRIHRFTRANSERVDLGPTMRLLVRMPHLPAELLYKRKVREPRLLILLDLNRSMADHRLHSQLLRVSSIWTTQIHQATETPRPRRLRDRGHRDRQAGR